MTAGQFCAEVAAVANGIIGTGIEEVIKRFCDRNGIGADSEIHPDARLRLRQDSETNKIALSTRSSVTFYRPSFFAIPT